MKSCTCVIYLYFAGKRETEVTYEVSYEGVLQPSPRMRTADESNKPRAACERRWTATISMSEGNDA
jgi:hypothetical protein